LPAGTEIHWLDLAVAGHSLADEARSLSPDELARARAFEAEAPRRRFVARRAALRRLLAQKTGSRPDEVTLCYAGAGKPFLAGEAGRHCHFSTSHSGDIGIVVLATVPVGVDVERLCHLPEAEGLLATWLTPEEAAEARRCHADPSEAFLAFWSAKEACLKVTGEGLGGPIHALGLRLSADPPRATGAPDLRLAPLCRPGVVGWVAWCLE
jgi:4'-phosphopantetheinyl transferase